jgi:hypothetical protein
VRNVGIPHSGCSFIAGQAEADRIEEPESVAARMLGQTVVALGSGVGKTFTMPASIVGHGEGQRMHHDRGGDGSPACLGGAFEANPNLQGS